MPQTQTPSPSVLTVCTNQLPAMTARTEPTAKRPVAVRPANTPTFNSSI
jgi:hypothetical protein